MKYKTFARLRLVAILVLCCGAFYGIYKLAAIGEPISPQGVSGTAVQEPSATPVVPDEVSAATAWLPSMDMAPFEMEILNTATTAGLDNGTLDGDSRKWRVKTSATTVEYRCDVGKGKTYWNRVKIDRDNDKSFDEKWDIKSGREVKRTVSTSDNGDYDAVYDLKGQTWKRR
jgi:hypothetical protein